MDADRFSDAPTFGDLLCRHRLDAGLTQDALAERAGLSRRGISDLERGARTHPHRETVRVLADALGLNGRERAAFAQQARRPVGRAAPRRGRETNLPVPLTPLIGRHEERDQVGRLLRADAVRLLTLTGPGGVGKTRLALAVAGQSVDGFPDGLVFVDLAPLRDPALVLSMVAAALGVRETGGRSLADLIHALLRARTMLLVLDNFEHLLEAAPVATDLLAAGPRVKILSTSRAPLHVRGEREYPVPPMAVPSNEEAGDLTALAATEAVALFVDRAQAVRPDFTLTANNAAAIVAICARLDGLPLALELSAARLRIFQPADLLARLDRRLPLLTGGARDLPPRQHTMQGAIAWTYDLLAPAEQRLWQWLAVFAGGFPLEAVEAVAPPDLHDPLAALHALVDHSLVTRGVGSDGASRFGMLETICEYGLARLAASGEERAARDAHAAYYLAFAERVAPDPTRDDDVLERVEAIAAEHANLLAALAHFAAVGAADDQVRLAALLAPFWFLRSLHSVGRACLERALIHPTSLPANEAVALANLARIATVQGDHAAAAVALDRAVVRATASGDPVALTFARTQQAALAVFQGEYAAAQAGAAEAQALARTGNDPLAAAFARFVQARAIHYSGELERAEALYRALLVDLPPPPRYLAATYRHSLAMIARTRGEHAEALAQYAASIGFFRDLGEQWSVANSLEGIAEALGALGRAEAAAHLFGAAAALRATIGAPMLPAELADYEGTVAAVRTDIGADAFAAAWETGGALAATAAVAEATSEAAAALDALNRSDRPGRSAARLHGLTPREMEILRLVAAQRTDQEIADTLFLSHRTVNAHVARILAKLDVHTRRDATVRGRDLGLLPGDDESTRYT